MIWKLAVRVVPLVSGSKDADSLYARFIFKLGCNEILTEEWRERQVPVKDAKIKILRRKKKDVMIRLDIYQWIEKQIEKGKFWSFNHAIETAVEVLRDSEKSKT